MSAKTEKKYDLTQGPILNRLLLVAVPIMGTQLMQMAYNLTDMFWLGRVDINGDAVAASGTAGMFLWLSMAFMMIGRMGAEIGVSQSIGAGDEAMAKKYSQNALFIALLLGVIYGLIMMIFRHPLIGFFGIQESHVANDAANYLSITGAAIPATYITGAIVGTFNASGNSRIPFAINAIGLVTNMILDPLFIMTMGMGIKGAAIATSLAQVIVAVLFILAILFAKGRPFAKYSFLIKPEGQLIRRIFQWTWPISLENMFFTLLSMLNTRIITQWGASAMAVQRVGSQVESLSWLIAGGFSSAITAFVGQNYGASKWSRIQEGIKISIRAMVAWGIMVTLILFFGGRVLFSLFLHKEELIEMGVIYLKFLALSQIVGCVEASCSGVFKGIGKTLPPSIASIGGNTLRVFIVYGLSMTSLGLNGIWLGISAGAAIRSLWMILWFLIMQKGLPKTDGVKI